MSCRFIKLWRSPYGDSWRTVCFSLVLRNEERIPRAALQVSLEGAD
jgi:hypothetical protein